MKHVKHLFLTLFLMMWAINCLAQFSGGDGSQSNPWQIASAVDLNNVRNYLGSSHADKYFIQTADIDLGVAPWNEGQGWYPIGTSGYDFCGKYNGNLHTISGLYINRATNYQGLFASLSGATISNIVIQDATVSGSSYIGTLAGIVNSSSLIVNCSVSATVTGSGEVGGLAGRNDGSSRVYNCSSSGAVNGTGDNIGGLVGSSYSNSEVISCNSSASVYGNVNTGGLVGNLQSSTITACSSSGSVASSGDQAGGLVGYNYEATIANCFSISSVNGASYVGGLVGYNGWSACTSNCYSTGQVNGSGSYVGGLVGFDYSSNVSDSYWNTDTSGQTTSYRGKGRSTAEMTYPYAVNTYSFWDFERIWAADTDYSHNSGYPYLVYNPDFVNPAAIAPSSGSGTETAPYQIVSLENLYWIAQDTSRWSKHYLQTADIDASQTFQWGVSGWTPIGNDTNKFSGSYDGGNHSISGLYINRPNTNNIGLLGITNAAKIKNLQLQGVTITGKSYTGALVGHNAASSVVENCSVSGNVFGVGSNTGALVGYNNVYSIVINCSSNSIVNGTNNTTGGLVGSNSYSTISSCSSFDTVYGAGGDIGGIVGSNNGFSTIRACSSYGTVYGTSGSTGGLAGSNNSHSTISTCSSYGTVYGTSGSTGGLVGSNVLATITACSSSGSVSSSGDMVGGLVGTNHTASIANSFSKSSVNGVSYVGGLVGYNNEYACISNCYSTGQVNGSGSSVGGLVGEKHYDSIDSNSYWNMETSGQTTSDGGEGRSTAGMTYPYAANTYRFWDFERIWAADTDYSHNNGYPYLIYNPDFVNPVAIAPSSGSGTEAAPYQIVSLENLYWIAQDTSRWDKHYLQTADIDATQTFQWTVSGWTPIGNATNKFTGSYNGGNHSISGLYISRPNVDNIGLFGYTSAATIKNLQLTGVSITGYNQTGALVGYNDASSIVEYCSVSGNIIGTGNDVGGLVGQNDGASRVYKCSSSGIVYGPGCNTGGLAGFNYSYSTISACSSSGTVYGSSGTGGLVGGSNWGSEVISCNSSASVYGNAHTGGLLGGNVTSAITACSSSGSVSSSGDQTGGLVGYNHGATIANSFSKSSVNGSSYVGGLVGYNSVNAGISYCYSTGQVNGSGSSVGGLVGARFHNSIESNSYWNLDTSGKTTSDGGEGRSTAEMSYPYAANTYRSWDFERIWAADTDYSHNNGYPYLVYNPDFVNPVAIAPSSGSGTEADPYQIVSLENLYWIAQDTSRWSKHYLQTADIDATQTFHWSISGWTPIGNATIKFSGSYDGGNHSISDPYISRPTTDNIGLFGYTNGAKIKNLQLLGVSITGKNQTGALVGYNDASSVIEKCSVSGNVFGMGSSTGALVGYNNGYSIVLNCNSSGAVYGAGSNTGGLVGYNNSNSEVIASHSNCDVYGMGSYTGGLVGYNHAASIANSFSKSSLNGTSYVGGLVGYNFVNAGISNCYSTGQVNGSGNDVGGLVGHNYSSTVSNSYWSPDTSGQATSSGGESRSTVEMTYPYPPHSYVSWDWKVWLPDMNSSVNDGYPYLYQQHEDYSALPDIAVNPKPDNAATTITADAVIIWQGQVNEAYSNLFTGFKLWLGTDNPPTNILDGLDLGRVFSYSPNPELEINTTYYWKVVPYNPVGDALDCPVWSFTTYNPAPQLVYPNGEELWMSNTTRQIRWAPNAPPLVKLDISFDNGTNWNNIGSTEGSSGIYHYQVPAQSSNLCRIKIYNAADESYADISDAAFSISTSTTLPKLMLSYPSVAGLHFSVGHNVDISWNRQNVSHVGLDYSLDNGISWQEIASNLNANAFTWQVPDSPANYARIRVRSMLNPDIFDISDYSFHINKVTILSPAGGELLTGDYSGYRKYLIRWQAPCMEKVSIRYSTDDGNNWATIATNIPAENGQYLWTIPAGNTPDYLLRILNDNNHAIYAQIDTPIRFQSPLEILNANGNGFVTDTSLFNIRWQIKDLAPDRQVYWEYNHTLYYPWNPVPHPEQWTRIDSIAVPITDEYKIWYVDTGLKDNAWLRAVEVGTHCVVARSAQPFRITDKQLKILSPATGDSLDVDSYATISWHATGCTNLIIEYTTDFGDTWLPIATNVPASQGSYIWQVPNTISRLCRIRLRDMTHSYMNVQSEGEFSIVPYGFVAAFHANITSGHADLTVQFFDDSVGYISSWAWDFNNDGITDSTEQNPLWTFRKAGFYTVKLTISDGENTISMRRNNYIYVLPMGADFAANHTSGFVPFTVQFTNLTLSDISASEWDFNGDGEIDSTDENPVWTYLFPGTYSVSQWVSNGYDEDICVKEDYITVSLNPAITRYVPQQYQTIQAAVNAANDGDYIIIANGIYYENVIIESKDITLASYFIIDGDSTHIANTIIDGSNSLNPDQASTLTIIPSSRNTQSQPHIIGFTIQGGSGRVIYENLGGSTVEKRVGGGVYIRQSNPILSYNRIIDNEADDEGGGSYAFQSVPNMGGMVNSEIGVYNPGANYFANNKADIGADIYVHGITQRDEMKLQNCSFEVMSLAENQVSNYWVSSSANADYQGSSGRHPALSCDLYVATNGSNSQNSGTSADSPFRTIDYALSRIFATPDNPLVIHIAAGSYSPSLTGEKYPLQMVKYVSLKGAGVEESFLDAEGNADFPRRVLNLDKVEGVEISDLTIMNGFVTMVKNYNGGAIGIIDSQAGLKNLIVANSSSAGNGAGLYALNSSVLADSLIFLYNNALGSGGGIQSVDSELILNACQIENNTISKNGGGLAIEGGNVSISDCQIRQNIASGYQSKGGGISLSGSYNAQIKGSTFAQNNADNGAAIYLQGNESFSIDRNRFENNLADFAGGALFFNSSSGVLSNNLIANNTATQRGAGIYSYSPIYLYHNTIVNNKADLQGGGLYLNNSSAILNGNILWGNTQGSAGSPNQIYLYGDTSDPYIRYCVVEGGAEGFANSAGTTYNGLYENNLEQNPLFQEPTPETGYHQVPAEDAYLLLDSSPCIDAGDPDLDMSLYPLDLAGNPRIDNNRLDIGAWESVHYHGALISANYTSLDFGRVNIHGTAVVHELIITNSGKEDLEIQEITLQDEDGVFAIQSGIRSQLLAPDASLSLYVSFMPNSIGNHYGSLSIQSNSLKDASLAITLNGMGIDASSSYPSSVQLLVIGDDVHLSWNPVLSDPQGNPYTPDGYIVLYSEIAQADADDYFFLNWSLENSYIHRYVVRYRQRMFYRIIAIDEDLRLSLSPYLQRNPGNLSWKELKKEIFSPLKQRE